MRLINANIMDSPHSSATSAPMPIYQTLLPFFFPTGRGRGGSGDETRVGPGGAVKCVMLYLKKLLSYALRSSSVPTRKAVVKAP